MWNRTRKLVAIFAVTLALLSIPAAASDNRTSVETTTQATGTVGDTVVDLRLLMLDRDLYPSTYEDHPYMCNEGNCTDG
jgi:hypothetical protein